MKSFFITLTLLITFSQTGNSQTVDIMINGGGHMLNFIIVKGKGMPILFETGGGDEADTWSEILSPVFDSTGATLITYSRAGFGKSELDTTRTDIVNGVMSIEKCLSDLGYKDDLMIVSHSLGGFYATLFAARNPKRVKGAVMFDANHSCFFTEEEVTKFLNPFYKDEELFRENNLAIYYTLLNFNNTTDLMRENPFPSDIPVFDIVAGDPPFEDRAEAEQWTDCHRQFADFSPERELIIATGAGHYVYKDNPQLAVESIVSMYRKINSEQK